MRFTLSYLAVALARQFANATCVSSDNGSGINSALSSGGAGTIIQICAGVTIKLTETIQFTADNQEISTQGYPTGSTRATLQIAAGSSISTLISGSGRNYVRILNIQVDGNRGGTSYVNGGGANIEIGGTSNGQVVQYVNSRNPRGWSCLHVTEGGLTSNYCTNATVSNNDIGPCGQSGTNAANQGLWADGISFACTDSLVQSNTITGSTDGGIVLFGAPGTTVTGNTITSSSSYLGFGAINMVDGTYNGIYTNVQVTNNNIVGDLLFGAGISIGACVWSGPCKAPYIYTGPATITGNTFSGHVAFPIAINGWTGGLTVSDNTVSAVTTPLSQYASDSGCSSVVKSLLSNNNFLSYYPAGLTGTQSLQSGFVAMPGNGTDFICPVPTSLGAQTSVLYGLNQLTASANTVLASLSGNIEAIYQGDGNIVVYDSSSGSSVVRWASGYTNSICTSSGYICTCNFQGDGNLVTYTNGVADWSSGTTNKGYTLEFLNTSPWIQISNQAGTVIWTTADS